MYTIPSHRSLGGRERRILHTARVRDLDTPPRADMATTTTIFPILNATEEDNRHVISPLMKRQWYSNLPGQLALQGSEFVTMIDHELAPVVAGIIGETSAAA